MERYRCVSLSRRQRIRQRILLSLACTRHTLGVWQSPRKCLRNRAAKGPRCRPWRSCRSRRSTWVVWLWRGARTSPRSPSCGHQQTGRRRGPSRKRAQWCSTTKRLGRLGGVDSWSNSRWYPRTNLCPKGWPTIWEIFTLHWCPYFIKWYSWLKASQFKPKATLDKCFSEYLLQKGLFFLYNQNSFALFFL